MVYLGQNPIFFLTNQDILFRALAVVLIFKPSADIWADGL